MLRNESGLTLLEVVLALALGVILIVGVSGIVVGALDQWHSRQAWQELLYQGNFAMDRIINAVTRTRRLLVPLADNPATAHNEALRDVLAVTLDPTLDRDADGFADADNDQDGQVDEDIPPDNTNDGAPGIVGIDDNNDGIADNVSSIDNDEDGIPSDDWINGLDDDGDGSIDEDIPRRNYQSDTSPNRWDNDGDGSKSEDWFDPVIYFVSADGKTLLERLPDVNPVDGNDFTERPIVQADNITLTVERVAPGPGERAVLLNITLQLVDDKGETLNLQSLVRVGGGN